MHYITIAIYLCAWSWVCVLSLNLAKGQGLFAHAARSVSCWTVQLWPSFLPGYNNILLDQRQNGFVPTVRKHLYYVVQLEQLHM